MVNLETINPRAIDRISLKAKFKSRQMKAICDEHGVKYRMFRSWLNGYQSNVNFMDMRAIILMLDKEGVLE